MTRISRTGIDAAIAELINCLERYFDPLPNGMERIDPATSAELRQRFEDYKTEVNIYVIKVLNKSHSIKDLQGRQSNDQKRSRRDI